MKAGPEDFEELFNLYVRGQRRARGFTNRSSKAARRLRPRLQTIWNTFEPPPFPITYHEFRRLVIDQILERLRKEDPRYRRPKF